jgi:hypothetical protein
MTMIGKTDIQKNRWYHFAVSWDGTTRRIYLNGNLEASDSPSGTLSSIIYDLHIGGRQNYFLDGKIDEVQVWNTARSQSDIQNTIYQSLPALKVDWSYTIISIRLMIFLSKIFPVQSMMAISEADVNGSKEPIVI